MSQPMFNDTFGQKRNYADTFHAADYTNRTSDDLERYCGNLENYVANKIDWNRPGAQALCDKLTARVCGIRGIIEDRKRKADYLQAYSAPPERDPEQAITMDLCTGKGLKRKAPAPLPIPSKKPCRREMAYDEGVKNMRSYFGLNALGRAACSKLRMDEEEEEETQKEFFVDTALE